MLKVKVIRIVPPASSGYSCDCKSSDNSEEGKDLTNSEVEDVLIKNLRVKLARYMSEVDASIVLSARDNFTDNERKQMFKILFSDTSDLSSVIEVVNKITSAIESKIRSEINRLNSFLSNTPNV